MSINEVPQFQAGEYFRVANGERICSEGQRVITMVAQEGTKGDMRFTVCGLSTAFGSVSQMRRVGHRVPCNPPWNTSGPYIVRIEAGECMRLEDRFGLCVER